MPDVPARCSEMIGVSDNDATAFILDVISDTCSGPMLDGRALRKFIDKRARREQVVRLDGLRHQRHGQAVELRPVRPRHAGGGSESREPQPRDDERRRLADALDRAPARRLSRGERRDDGRCSQRPLDPLRKEENQVKEFLGESLPAGSKLWSKAGWTSEVRHDAAYIELPNGKKT